MLAGGSVGPTTLSAFANRSLVVVAVLISLGGVEEAAVAGHVPVGELNHGVESR
jgi:hypothetical protein